MKGSLNKEQMPLESKTFRSDQKLTKDVTGKNDGNNVRDQKNFRLDVHVP